VTDGMKHPGTSGGYSDKKGNQYELIWAVEYALKCIQDERRSITYEELDPDLAEGSEFTYVDEHDSTHVFQVKRQKDTSDKWTIDTLERKRIFKAARSHVAAKRQYQFGSMTSCTKLRELSNRARESDNFNSFAQYVSANQELMQEFEKLAELESLGSREEVWKVLQSMHFAVMDEGEYKKIVITLAEAMLDGAEGSVLFSAIGSVLLDNLRKRLTKNELLDLLAQKEIFVPEDKAKQTARDKVRDATARWQRSVQRELLDPEILRAEATQLINQLDSAQLSFVIGAAGSGKSAVINQVVEKLKSQDAEVLAFRLDRCADFNSTKKLGKRLELPKSPVASLQQAANERDAVLVIDQLDAMSLMSGRLPNSSDAVADLVDEAMALNIRVILACRLFDFENDHRIREISAKWKAQHVTVGDLSDDAVANAVTEMGGDFARLTEKQRELLRLPLRLVLFKEIIDQPNAYSFTTPISLFNAFWNRKRKFCKKDHPELHFNDTLELIAKTMSNKQVLSIAKRELDRNDCINDAEVLASENLLVFDNQRVSFFHEAFFDYVFARQWLSDEQNLVEFLCSQEQGLFRRAQVRQILEMLLAEEDFKRFREEVKELLLEKEIRFHIKEIAIIIFGGIDSPKDEDLDLVSRINNKEPEIGQHLRRKLVRANWFGLLYEKEIIQKWLDCDDPELRGLADASLHNAVDEHAEIVAKLLSSRRDMPEYPKEILRFVSWIKIYKSRPLFELLLDVAQTDNFSVDDQNLWISLSNLAKHEPHWMIELLTAYLENVLNRKLDNKITAFNSYSDGFNRSIEYLSKLEPKLFVEAIVPYLLDAMRKTEKKTLFHEDLLSDTHFAYFPSTERIKNVGSALYNGVIHALVNLVLIKPQEIEPILYRLATDNHIAAQTLLFHAFIANPKYFATWAVGLILEGENRLKSGYLSDPYWISREVVRVIAPYVSDENHELLERKLRDLHNPYERENYRGSYRNKQQRKCGSPLGRTAFKFLSALDRGRLSPLGTRRLAEYKRKFSSEVLSPPTGITGGVIGPPISSKAAAKMSDQQWLRAMHKYHDERVFPSLEGGAYELSTLLNQFTVDDPSRFADLAMKMTPDMNPVYPSAILWGFSEASIPDNAKPVVFEAIRHIASLRSSECDEHLGRSLQHLAEDVPLDLVEKVIDRTVCAFESKNESTINTSPNRDLEFEGINTTRGSLAYSLANLLSYDKDGTRTAKVTPHLVKWASNPVLSVRTCVAHIIGACLWREPVIACEAFDQLIDTDDILLATESVERLILYIGNSAPKKIDPVVDRMLKSKEPKVREVGGNIAVFAACHWNRPQLMKRILAGDKSIRKGAAKACTGMIGKSQSSKLVLDMLRELMYDNDDEVREIVGGIGWSLRGHKLYPLTNFLKEFIESPSYIHAIPQLLTCLEETTDRVDELIDLALHRFIDVNGGDIADIRTRASLDAYQVSDLVIRGLAQTKDKKRISALLDILDRLVEMNVFDINEKIERIERH
jgi:hypothetical protein